MRRRLRIVGVVVVLGALALGAAACGDDNGDGGNETPTSGATEPEATQAGTPATGGSTVDVDVKEYAVEPAQPSAPAGGITFDVANSGSVTHEFVVIKTDLAPDALPTKDDGSFDSAGEGVQVLGEIEDIEYGGSKSSSFNMEAGEYVLICNRVVDGQSHYANGMRVAFEVTE